MSIQYVSDLHLELSSNRLWLAQHPIRPAGEILIIAGDTAYLDDEETDAYSKYAFWDNVSKQFKQVIVCFGNHEFYGGYDVGKIPDGYERKIRDNVTGYYNGVVHLDDIDVIVSTLWAKIDPPSAFVTERGVQDFHKIRRNGKRLTADTFNEEHERCLAFVKNTVAESTAKTKIVVTHHVPTHLCTADEFLGSPINGAFTAELGEYIAESDIKLWIYGHSHRNIDAAIGGTHLRSNQLGYVDYGEHLRHGFDLHKSVDTELILTPEKK